jgi:hypothetical protein
MAWRVVSSIAIPKMWRWKEFFTVLTDFSQVYPSGQFLELTPLKWLGTRKLVTNGIEASISKKSFLNIF